MIFKINKETNKEIMTMYFKIHTQVLKTLRIKAQTNYEYFL